MDPKALRGGRYVILAQLGEGSQGTTWDAVDKRVGAKVAIKRFDVRGARSWKDVELAEREARVLSALSHRLLPAYVEHFEEEGVLYLVMEQIEGTPLSVLRQRGALAEADVVRFLRDASEVLGYLHGRAPPVVHRDIKPSNVIRRPDGSFALVDFGAVRDRLRPTGGSTVVGTFGYMAPEQFQGRAGPHSDVYAVGATALTLLTGREPEDLPHRGLAIDVRAALPSITPRLGDLLLRMLEPDPERRAASMVPLLAEFERGARPAASRAGGSGEWRPPRNRGFERPAEDFGADRGRAIRARVQREIEDKIRGMRQELEPLGSGRERKRAARALRRARRDERRRALRHRHPVPWFVLAGFLLGIHLARVGITLALRVLVPTVLVLLSIVLGRRLREAAGRVARAGVRADEALERTRNEVLAERGWRRPTAAASSSETSGVRVDPGARVRVDDHAPRDPAPAQDDLVEPDETNPPRRTYNL